MLDMLQKQRFQSTKGGGLGILGGVILATSPAVALAQITGDGTLSTQVNGSAIAPCTGGCTINGGTSRGSNLFHSFKEFSIPAGGQAWFDNDSQIQAIFTRVTGSNPSSIDGLIKANGSASLFLLNPNGILFGSHAALDIGGSFLATTANALTFGNGSKFSATNPQAPPLLTLNVTPGLQWGNASGALVIEGAQLQSPQNLTLAASRIDGRGQIQAGRDLVLYASDTVQLRDSLTQPLQVAAQGQLLIQGDRQVEMTALNHPQSGLWSGRDMIWRSANPVLGDIHGQAGGNLRIEQLDGALGSLVSPHDPVLRASGDVSFASYTGTSLHILAGGSVTISDRVTLTGAGTPATSLQETVTLSDGTTLAIDGSARPTLDIRAGTTAFGNPSLTGSPLGFTPPPTSTGTPTSTDIVIGSIGAANGGDISDRLVF